MNNFLDSLYPVQTIYVEELEWRLSHAFCLTWRQAEKAVSEWMQVRGLQRERIEVR